MRGGGGWADLVAGERAGFFLEGLDGVGDEVGDGGALADGLREEGRVVGEG